MTPEQIIDLLTDHWPRWSDSIGDATVRAFSTRVSSMRVTDDQVVRCFQTQALEDCPPWKLISDLLFKIGQVNNANAARERSQSEAFAASKNDNAVAPIADRIRACAAGECEPIQGWTTREYTHAVAIADSEQREPGLRDLIRARNAPHVAGVSVSTEPEKGGTS